MLFFAHFPPQSERDRHWMNETGWMHEGSCGSIGWSGLCSRGSEAVEAGHEALECIWPYRLNHKNVVWVSRGCCSVEDAADAARAAEIMGIPFYVWDLAEEFEQTVITDFVDQYKAGHTPNPCVRCNEFVKFRELAQRARALGFDAVCTGHYARIVQTDSGPQLHRGRDEAKDQSYVLAIMGPEELPRVIFPLEMLHRIMGALRSGKNGAWSIK